MVLLLEPMILLVHFFLHFMFFLFLDEGIP